MAAEVHSRLQLGTPSQAWTAGTSARDQGSHRGTRLVVVAHEHERRLRPPAELLQHRVQRHDRQRAARVPEVAWRAPRRARGRAVRMQGNSECMLTTQAPNLCFGSRCMELVRGRHPHMHGRMSSVPAAGTAASSRHGLASTAAGCAARTEEDDSCVQCDRLLPHAP